MLAIDTNVVVRYVGDGGEQFGRAVDIIENNEISIALTVVLETERVLCDAYQYLRQDILAALKKIFVLPTVMLNGPTGRLEGDDSRGFRAGLRRRFASGAVAGMPGVRDIRQAAYRESSKYRRRDGASGLRLPHEKRKAR